MPTVLHVLEAVGGGTAKHLVDAVRHVDGVDHVAAIPARRRGGLSDELIVRRLQDAGADVRLVPMRRRPLSLDNALAVLRLRRLVRKVQPELVHAHSSVGGALARLAVAGTGVKVVWTPNALGSGRVAVLAQRLLHRRTAAIIAVSPSERDLILRERIGRPDRVVFIPNGVERESGAAPVDLRRHFGLPPKTPLIGTVSRLVPQKAPLDFVRACAAIAESRPDVHFLLVGDGPLDTAVTRETERLGLTGRLHRLVMPHDAHSLMPQFDLFLLTSLYEGGPYTPMEAMAAGVPVVVTDCVGSRDTVEHERNGLVVPAADAAAMAAAALRLLDDELLRARLLAGARGTLATRFDLTTIGRQLRLFYAELTGHAAAPALPAALAGVRLIPTRGTAPVLAGREVSAES